MTTFVHTVDNILRMQEETERVKDAMSRITAYSVGDVPHELKEVSVAEGTSSWTQTWCQNLCHGKCKDVILRFSKQG